MPKKVLIIAYYWPPAGGPGVQRWLKFIKYLPEFDIETPLFGPDMYIDCPGEIGRVFNLSTGTGQG